MSARVVYTDEAGVAAAAAVVRSGGVLVYPTETVYGLGCASSADSALARIRHLKGREADKPMLVLTDTWARVGTWWAELTAVHERLMEHPGPLTLLFSATAAVPPGLVSPGGTVGVRRTGDPFCRSVIAMAGHPLVSTSANRSGTSAPATFAGLTPSILRDVDLAVDAGAPLAGSPSTVVRVDGGELVVVREGAVSEESLLRWVVEGEGGAVAVR